MEQEKDELYQKFIAYKKQVQEEYAAKLITLQEREKYLAEKVDEYEKDINRHQTDLKQRAHTIQQLASVNTEVESAVAHWPAFQNVLSQIEAHSKLIEEAHFQIPSPVKVQKSPVKAEDNELKQSPIKIEDNKPKQSPVKVEEDKPKQSPIKTGDIKPKKSPIRIQEKKLKQSPPKDEPHHVDLHQVHHDIKENDVIAELPVQYEQHSPDTENINAQVEEQGLGIEPHKSVNDDEVNNTPETRVEDNSQGLYEQEKNEEVQNKLDMDAFQSSEPVEPLDNGWGIEEPPLIEIENKRQEPQETYGQQHEQPQPVEEYREVQVDYGYQEIIEQRVEEYTEQREQPAEYNYEQPVEQYAEQREDYGEYNYEEQVQHYREENYPTEPVEYNQEYREEPVQPAEYYQESTEHKVDQIKHQEEVVQPLEVNYDEPQVHVEQTENRDFEEQPPAMQPENASQSTYSNAFTAVPAYRMPAKKKKKASKKSVAAFKPVQATYNMPDQPQDLVVEEPSHQQAYEVPVEQPSYSHYEAPVDQPPYSYYETSAADQPPYSHYEAPVEQSSHYNHEAPVVHNQEQGYEQSGWANDNIELDSEVRPPVEEPQPEVEIKPPQTVAFGIFYFFIKVNICVGRTPLQAKKAGAGKKSKLPKPNAPKLNTFSQPWTPPVNTYMEYTGINVYIIIFLIK